MTNLKSSGPRPSDKYIPWYIVAFFVVMIVVLAPMGYLAVHTLPGVVTEGSYEKGLAYNKDIAAAAAQRALGWTADLSVAEDKTGAVQAVYVLRDAQGQPVDGAKVHLWLVRPTTSGMDRDIDLPAQGRGRYADTLTLPARGVWDAKVSATRGGENFQTQKRIVLP